MEATPSLLEATPLVGALPLDPSPTLVVPPPWEATPPCPTHPKPHPLVSHPQEIYKDRQKFSEQVFKVASSDLVNMGISVVSYTLKDIHDDQVAPGWGHEGEQKGTWWDQGCQHGWVPPKGHP